MKKQIFTRVVCMILCICMLLPTFASCFGKNDEGTGEGSGGGNNVTPEGGDSGNNEGGGPGNNGGGGNSGGESSGGETETTYYKVNFAVALEEYKNRVNLPREKLYKEGTEIQYLPTPAVRDLIFMGWYYDAAMTKPVALTDKVNSDLMLYAKVVDTSEDISVIDGVYYHTAYDVEADYTFALKADSLEIAKANIIIENISSAGTALTLGTDYTVTDNGDGTYEVAVAYKAGKTYRASLTADSGVSFVVDGVTLNSKVTTLNILVIKEEVANLTLADGLIYIPKADVELLTDAPNGLVSVSGESATVNSGDEGYLRYDGATLKSGDRISVYEGDVPSARDFGTDNGAVKYLTIIGVEGNNLYKFRVSDSEEVLFIPDIIPVEGKTNVEKEAKISVSTLDFTGDLYRQLGMDEDTVVNVGDYLAFFDGPMVEGTPVEYVRISSVRRDNQYYYINYIPVSYDDVIASMDLYHTRTNTPELSDEQIEAIKTSVYKDAMDSGFVDEAAAYLVNLYLSTNGLESLPVSGGNSAVAVGSEIRIPSYSGGKSNVILTGGSGLYYEVTKCEAEPDIKIGDGVLEHFEESDGIRVELVLSFEVEFTIGEDGKNKVVIAAEAVFEEEILLSINVEGGAVWEMAWIFPYIVDYEMNANIDIGTYTGVSVIAKVYTNNGEEKEEEEEDDSFFPDFDLDNIGKGDSYEEKAKNIGEELKKLFELNDNIKEEVEGEEEDDTGNDITEKYAEMMKDANEAWIEIVRVEIYKQSTNLDTLGILWFEFGVDFVVSAQLYIMAGIEVETGVAKRYNFSVALFARTVKTDVIDLEKAHFSFKFYCMGTAGLKVGFELSLSLALLSSDVASVGISAELGVSLGIWGYFYYSYEKEAGEEPEIQKAGAMFFELGIYVEVKFKAHLFNIEKLTYNPTLYENFWPIYSVGTQENVFEFEDYEDRELTFVMQGTNTLTLPDYIFRMKYLDLKDGKYYSGKGSSDETPSKSFDDETESRFLIEISDSRFTYDPKTNTLSTTVDVKNMDVDDTFEIKIQITYKHGALAFNQEVITREITVQVKNNLDYGYVYVWLNGPSYLNAVGPSGAHTYALKHGETFTLDMLPTYDYKEGYKFVKWIWMQNYRDVNDKLWVEGDEFVGLASMERRTHIYLTAVWEPQDIDCTLRIFKESVGGTYVFDKTQTVTGLIKTTRNLSAILNEPGYVLRAGSAQYIEFKYQASYDVYLERATKTIRFLNVDGEGGEIVINAKVGSALVPPVVSSRLGYNFVGWADGASHKLEPCVMPETVPNFNYGTKSYTALWEPISDVPYTVKHYVQNANDDGYSLYMTEYLTASYDEPLKMWNHFSTAVTDAGFTFTSAVNPDYNTVYRVALDGSTTLRIYYTRDTYEVYNRTYSAASGYTRYSLGFYRHGQTVDLSECDVIPSLKGYCFMGWDANSDGIADDSFVMPQENFEIGWIKQATDGTEYKVIHMIQDAETENYVQAGVTAMYGVTGTTPDPKAIYSDKYAIEGQFVANYAKARVSKITPNTPATMYAYYDRVDYRVEIKAYHPETNALVSTTAYSLPYGKTIKLSTDRSYLSHFDVAGYQAARLANPGYTEMPAHDIEINVVYTPEDSVPFIVNHFCETAIGSFELYQSIVYTGRAGTALHDIYRQYVLSELDSGFSVSTELIAETYVAGRGYTMFNIYYLRDKVTVTGNIHKLDLDGNVVESIPYAKQYRLDETVYVDLDYDGNYVFERRESRTEGDTYTAKNRTYRATQDMVMDIYVKPKSGVPYTVTHWVENVDGTGYEVYATYNYTGTHTAEVSAQFYVKNWPGIKVEDDSFERIVLDASKENNLNVYYTRETYWVTFYNGYSDEGGTSNKVRFGATVPTPPTNTDVSGYTFVEWEGYTEDAVVTGAMYFRAVYAVATDTPYKVNHYVMDAEGNYQLMICEDRTGSTNAEITAAKHLHADYNGNGYTLREDTSVRIAPDGSTVLDVYYDRESYRFSYHYYVGGKIVNSIGVLIMHGAATPDSIHDHLVDYPEYELDGYSILQNGEYVPIAELPTVMGKENVEIRITLKAIGPEVTIVHKVMNPDGETYSETRESFLTIPFEALDLTMHTLASYKVGFTYRIPVNNQIPDALKENVYEIYYDRNTYTIEYFSDYKLESVTESYLYGASIGKTPVFTRPGYIHTGWNTDIPETMPARNLTFTTTWQVRDRVPVTIVHMMSALDGDGYVECYRETVSHTPELMIYGSNYATIITGGIYKSADKKTVAMDGSTEICVYYTRNEYTVRFTYGDIAGAGADVVLTLPYGSDLTAPDFKVNGYTLVGWTPDLPEKVTAENITYTAKWAADSVNVTVKHWHEGLDGTDVLAETETASAETGSTVNGAGYKKSFTGFTYEDADKNVTVNSDGSTVINVYYARNSYKVTYTYGEKSGDQIVHTVKYGATLPTAPTFTVQGYTFDGWDSNLATAMPANDLTYNAEWIPSTNTAFTVEHHYQNANDDGYTVAERETKYGTTGTSVNGENYKKALAEAVYASAESKTVNADGTTVIKVYYVRTTYTLTFTYGDKTGESAEYTLRYGQSISHNPTFTAQGYTFAGWDKAIPTAMPADNVVINATWNAASGIKYTVEHYVQNANDDKYTLEETDDRSGTTGTVIDGATLATLAGNGIVLKSAEKKAIEADGSTVIEIYYDRAVYTVTYTYGDMAGNSTVHSVRYGATLPTAPSFTAVGYTFDGWDSELVGAMPAKDITYKAQWKANTDTAFTVEHHYQNANDNNYTVVETETKYGTTNTSVNGENYKKALAEAIYEKAESKTVNADGTTVIKVYYVRTTYTLTFTHGDKTGESAEYTLRYGQSVSYNPSFTAEGYVFEGWDKTVPATMPAENVTVNATWKAGDGVAYKVLHYVQNANDDKYTLEETDDRSGTTGTVIDGATLATLVGNGIVLKSAEKEAIEADGSTVIEIYYDRAVYTVTYTYGDMAGNSTVHSVRYGATLPTAPTFTAQGYTFDGWDSELVVAMPAKDITYKAQWKANTDTAFTVEHHYQNANDNNYTVVETETKYGTTDTSVNGENYKKALAEAIYEKAESKTVNADGSTVIKVYYVRTTYTLTFTYGDKTGENVQYTLRYGQSVSHNPTFTAQGYIFASWDKAIPTAMPAENVTVNATWSAGSVQYKVEHYVQNANDDDYSLTSTETKDGVTGATVDGATLATLVGNGIVLKSAQKKAIAADGSTVIEIYYDRVVYTVTYTYGDKVGNSTVHSVRYGATLPTAPTFTVVGYTFDGWDSDLASEMPATNLTYNAKWAANSDTEFTVEHHYQNANDNGYTVVNSETMQGVTGSTVNGVDFKQGIEEAIFEKADRAVIAPDGTTVIKVYYVRTTYTLTFSYGFVSQDEQSYTVRYGASLPEAPTFSTMGYTFNGWLDEEGLYVDALAEAMPAGDLVYTAFWMENEDTPFKVEHYIEEADGNGYVLFAENYYQGRTGENVEPYMYIDYDDGERFIFDRFNNDDLTILPDGSAVLKIYYNRVRYSVTFTVVDQQNNPIDGIESIILSFKFEETITPHEFALIDGYEFYGYECDYELMPAEDVEYFIVWSCIHESTDGNHECDRCYETIECADENDDGHCDYGREPSDPDNHRYLDDDGDHVCDICCGSFYDLCEDIDENGKCDVCDQPTLCKVTGETHLDEDDNHRCDDCEVWLSFKCSNSQEDIHQCSGCLEILYYLCTDEDDDCICDVCNNQMPCIDEDGDLLCDVCGRDMPCPGHTDENLDAVCDVCGEPTWCEEADDMHRDNNYDHTCDNCGVWISSECSDGDEDGRCDQCNHPYYCMEENGREHIDGDGDHYCDECTYWLSYVCIDEGGDWYCDICERELTCFEHVDEDQNALCDLCGEETLCKKNPNDSMHEDYESAHTCDHCGVWISIWCHDDDYDGYCDDCERVFVCNHVDDDEDNYCDLCYRVINCTHDSVTDEICDECGAEVKCLHPDMEGEHVCYYCYIFLTDCIDEDGDGSCDLANEYFPH